MFGAKGRPAHPGVLRWDGRSLDYESRLGGSFAVPAAEVAVVGEYTNDNGPFLDDYFLVLVRRGGAWSEVPVYCQGFAAARDGLAAAIGADLGTGLAGSSTFASRVLWPVDLVGRPLLNFTPTEGSGLLRRIKLWCAPEVDLTLTPEVRVAADRGGRH